MGIQILRSPLPPPRPSSHYQRGQILTNVILLQWENLTAFGICTLRSAKQLSSVMMKDTCRTTMKYPVNAGTWHSNTLPRETLFVSTGSEAIAPCQPTCMLTSSQLQSQLKQNEDTTYPDSWKKQFLLYMQQLDCSPIFMVPNCLHFIIPSGEEKVQ